MSDASSDGMGIGACGKQWSDTDLVQICRHRARLQPSDIAYTYLVDGETEEVNLTYDGLDRRARSIAAELQGIADPGDRVLLVFEPGLDYIAAFFGCLYANVVAVPVYPPNMLRLDRALPRLTAIVSDAQAKVVLCTSEGAKWASLFTRDASEPVKVLPIDDLRSDADDRWTEPTPDPHRLAYLQYTSGSTGQPKGVMVSHRNMLYNVSHMDRRRSGENVIGVTWLPAYHDFGLVGAILLPMFTGCRTISMSPLAFVQRPLRWLLAISKYRGTITGAPNFSFDLCVNRTTPDERRRLDLSCLSIILNGAEPIRHETMHRFLEAFGPCGLPADAFVPSYGLAEATLGVSSARTWTPYVVREVDAAALERSSVLEPKQGETRTLVSSGVPFPNTEVAIACPRTKQRLPSDRVGEIWVQGPGVAAGYWDRPEATAENFAATFSLSEDACGKWLRTGDLGFLNDGQLFITGRLKDIIIVNGRNLYPQDIEETVQTTHPAMVANAGAAFSISQDGQERLVVVQEVRRPKKVDLQVVAAAIQEAVLLTHNLPLSHLVLVKAGTIPKTTSGKIQRSESRKAWLENRLSIVGYWQTNDGTLTKHEATSEATPLRTDTERRVASIFCEVLSCSPPGSNENFFDLGGQSLLATQLVVRVREEFQIDMPLRTLFLSPTVAGLAAEIDRLVESADSSSTSKRYPEIIPLETVREARLSTGQERIWFVQHLTPGLPLFNLCLSVRMQRKINIVELEQAWNDLGNRHDGLRTSFLMDGKHPRPRIQPDVILPFRHVNLCDWEDNSREEELSCIEREEAATAFELATAPLWRVTLVSRSESDYTLILAMHHIVSDGWSMSVLMRELMWSYDRRVNGQAASALESANRPAIQYTDYAAWQRSVAMNEIADQQISYWRKQLTPVPAVLKLPVDRPRPASPTFQGATLGFVLAPEVSRGVEQLGRSVEATPFMVIMAALQALLARYSGQHDVCVGTAVAGRSKPELEGVVGFFVNTLVLRGDLSGDPTFREFLLQIRESSLAAFDHADVPFERLVDELAPQRDMRHAPLFQVSLVFQNQPWQEPVPGVELREVHNGTSKYDLTWTMWNQDSQLKGALEYSTELFNASTVQQLIDSLQTLLSDAIGNPDSRISELSLAGGDQMDEWLQRSSGERVAYREDVCVHELIEEQVSARPSVLAIDGDDESLTYDELNRQANRLARKLQQMGVGPETLVGISIPRSAGMIKALVATHKAGGCCLPLDPEYPHARIAQTLQDAQPRVVLTDRPALFESVLKSKRGLQSDDPNWSVPQIVDIKCCETECCETEISDENLAVVASPTNLAYVIYTSGSTGIPKGVMVEHRNVCHMVTWYSKCLGVSSDSRVLQFASLSFDASMGEIFTTLCQGATLVLPPCGKILPGQPLIDFLQRQDVTSALIPPSFLEMLPAASLPGLQDLTVSGEVCPQEVILRFAPGRRMYNGYGPTEATVGATWHECNALPGDGHSLIGRPFPNVRVYLLDSNQQPVPAGVTGEIYIAGAGVARGYLNRPELSVERFLPDPFKAEGRMYRTGDLARYRSDGNLEYMGRCDKQVKIRGFRIEPGEIGTALQRIDGIRRAVVVACQQKKGQRLVAYFTTEDCITREFHPEDIRGKLALELPQHMIPSEFVRIKSWPLSPTGKIDRSKLAAIPREPLSTGLTNQSKSKSSEPRNDSERKLVEIWRDVLNLERVGIHDNYFEAGGNSLHIMQITANAAAVGLRLTPRQLLENQTIAHQAAAALPVDTAIEECEESGDIPLSPIQLWFLDGNPAEPDHFNQAVMFELEEVPNTDALRLAVAESFARHDALRLRCVNTGGRWRQYYDEASVSFALNVVDLATDTSLSIEQLAVDQQTRLNLASGPTILATLMKPREAERTRLLFVAHHLFIDAVSWQILLDDLSRSYIARLQGLPVAWPPKSASFGQFVRRCEQLSMTKEAEWNAADWQNRLLRHFAKLPRDGDKAKGSAEQTELPNVVGDCREHTVKLSEAETSCLVKHATRFHRAQVQELLLTALAETLIEFSQGDAVRIDLESNGRDGPWDDLDLARTVGWFTTIEPLVVQRTNAGDLLANVKRELRESRRHHDFGIHVYLSENAAVLQQNLSDSRAQVCFNFLGMLDAAENFAGLSFARDSVGPLRSPQQDRHYDFEINAMIRDGGLQVAWTFSPGLHGEQNVERLARKFLDNIRQFLPRQEAKSQGVAIDVDESAANTPRDALEYELAEMWESELQRKHICVDESFDSLGGSADAFARVLAEASRRFGITVDQPPCHKDATVSDVAAMLRETAAHTPQSPLISIQSRGEQTPIFLVHPAGGNVFPYYNLAHRLGVEQPVWALEAQGLEGVMPPLTSVGALADVYLKTVVHQAPKGPYRIGGWSFGGLVAYEMAHRLRQAGEEVELLALLDTRVVAGGVTSQAQAAFAALLAMVPSTDEQMAADFLSLDPEVQLTQFNRHVETAGLAPAGTSRSSARRMLGVFEANSQAWLEYVPPAANGPVHLFVAEKASTADIFSEDLGWSIPAGDFLNISKTPGDHLTMMREPHTMHLARRIVAAITR